MKQDDAPLLDYVKDAHYINGLSQYSLDIKSNISLYESQMCHLLNTNEVIEEVIFDDFSPGSIIIFE